MQHGSTGTPQRKGRCGRKRISSQQDDRALARLSKANRKMTSRRLMVEMNTSGVQMSSRTVRRRLIEAGVSNTAPAGGPVGPGAGGPQNELVRQEEPSSHGKRTMKRP
jgi:Transposase